MPTTDTALDPRTAPGRPHLPTLDGVRALAATAAFDLVLLAVLALVPVLEVVRSALEMAFGTPRES